MAIACQREPQPQVLAAAPVVATPSAPASTTRTPERPGYASSVALFTGDQLTACVDLVTDATLFDDVGRHARMAPQLLVDDEALGLLSKGDTVIGPILEGSVGKDNLALLLPPGKPQPIGKPCDEQFPGRLVVAGCVLGAGTKTRVALAIQSFDATSRSDRMMRGCLAAKGTWQEADRGSRELRRERLQQQLRALQQQQ